MAYYGKMSISYVHHRPPAFNQTSPQLALPPNAQQLHKNPIIHTSRKVQPIASNQITASKNNSSSLTLQSTNLGSNALKETRTAKPIGSLLRIIAAPLIIITFAMAIAIAIIFTQQIITTSTSTTSTTTTTARPIVAITQAGDPIIGIYKTTAGGSIGGINGSFSTPYEYPPSAIDGSTSTKYLNFGVNSGGITAYQPGLNTGFYVTPVASTAAIALSLLFATANDAPDRDPVTVTLEGTNVTSTAALYLGSSWTLIYSGPTGINATVDPGRNTYVAQQSFSNTRAFRSYRLLVTSQRGNTSSVQYSEAEIIGYL